MLIEDFVNNVLDNISYCEDYLLYLRANNLISDKDELMIYKMNYGLIIKKIYLFLNLQKQMLFITF